MTRLYEAVLSTRGATITRFSLSEYQQFDQQTPVQLVGDAPALGLRFQSPGGRNRDTRDFYFNTDYAGNRLEVLSGEQSSVLCYSGQQRLDTKDLHLQPGQL